MLLELSNDLNYHAEFRNASIMKILAFDTSNNTVSVAISEGKTILAYIEDLTPSVQAERLLPMIEEALKYAGLSYSAIDYLAVTNGPGSFTGIRIGLAAAKGILLGTSIKGSAVTNFEIWYFRTLLQIKNYNKIYIFLDAYREQLYLQIFNSDSSVTEPLLIDYDLAVTMLQQEQQPLICAGSGIRLIYQRIKHLPYLTILPRFARIKASHICRYLSSTIESREVKPIEPLYIRPPDAKVISTHFHSD